MKTIYMTLAAVSALAVAAPVAAQAWQVDKTAPQSRNDDRSDVAQLRVQLDAGVQRGTITRREAIPLRTTLGELVRMERTFSGNGFNARERNILQLRSASLRRQMNTAERNGNGRDRSAGRDGGDRAGFVLNDRRDMRGDRFNGDLRVGQHVSARPVALPMEYRDRFRDSDASYYRYDEDRVYQIDRHSGLIMAMFDIRS